MGLKLNYMMETELLARAQKSARTIAVLAFVCSAITTSMWSYKGVITFWQWALSTVVSGVLLVIIFLVRRKSLLLSTAVFLGCLGIVFFASAVTNNLLAFSNARFEAFLGYKLGALAVAIIAPFPIWIGFFIIGFSGIAPVVQYFLLPPEIQTNIFVQEPWASVIYAIIAAAILYHRLREVKNEREIIRIKTRKKALNDLAAIFLSLRDLTNTPLQSIELTAALLNGNVLERREASRHLERSLVHLREVSQVLKYYEKDVDWSKVSTSFDAVTDLQQKLSEIRSPSPIIKS
jgi:hypothetical protein